MDENFANSFYWLADALKITILPTYEQGEILGGLSAGCAWELVDDIRLHVNSAQESGKETLSDSERSLLEDLLEKLDSIPRTVFESTGMEDQFWTDHSDYFINILKGLDKRIRQVNTYFGKDSHWLDKLDKQT